MNRLKNITTIALAVFALASCQKVRMEKIGSLKVDKTKLGQPVTNYTLPCFYSKLTYVYGGVWTALNSQGDLLAFNNITLRGYQLFGNLIPSTTINNVYFVQDNTQIGRLWSYEVPQCSQTTTDVTSTNEVTAAVFKSMGQGASSFTLYNGNNYLSPVLFPTTNQLYQTGIQIGNDPDPTLNRYYITSHTNLIGISCAQTKVIVGKFVMKQVLVNGTYVNEYGIASLCYPDPKPAPVP